ncbi:hypothetical protein MD484_g4793, partial [Candolleomyces efflorescens]
MTTPGQADNATAIVSTLPAPGSVVEESTSAPMPPTIEEIQLPDEQPTVTITPIGYVYPSKTSWTIQGVVKEKSELKPWFNRHLCLEQKVFTMILSDASGDIKVNVMGEDSEEIYLSLETGKVYRIDKPKIIMAKKKLSGLSHDWEILFGKDTKLVQGTY